jgi:hypothetical protein
MSYNQSDGTPSPPSWEEYYTDYPHLQSNVFGTDGVPQSGEYDPTQVNPTTLRQDVADGRTCSGHSVGNPCP